MSVPERTAQPPPPLRPCTAAPPARHTGAAGTRRGNTPTFRGSQNRALNAGLGHGGEPFKSRGRTPSREGKRQLRARVRRRAKPGRKTERTEEPRAPKSGLGAVFRPAPRGTARGSAALRPRTKAPPGRAADRPTFRRPGPGGTAPDPRPPTGPGSEEHAALSARRRPPPAGPLAAPPPQPRAVRAGSSWLGPDVIQTWQQLHFKARRGAPGPPARRAGSDRTARSCRSFDSPRKSLPNPLGPLPALRAPDRRRHTVALCFPPAGPGCVPPGFCPRPGSALSGPPSHRCARSHLRSAPTCSCGLHTVSATHRLPGEKI